MVTPPDGRAVLIIGALVSLGVLSLAVPFESALAVPFARTLYVAVIAAGAAFGLLDIRVGYSLIRPNITREQSPFLFWVEVAASLAFVVFGVVKLWHS